MDKSFVMSIDDAVSVRDSFRERIFSLEKELSGLYLIEASVSDFIDDLIDIGCRCVTVKRFNSDL